MKLEFMCLGLSGIQLLFAIGFGYIVCYLAAKVSKPLRTLGYCIGGFIIAVSLVLIVIKGVWLSQVCSSRCEIMGKHHMGMGGPGMGGPGMGGMMMREQNK